MFVLGVPTEINCGETAAGMGDEHLRGRRSRLEQRPLGVASTTEGPALGLSGVPETT